VTPRFALCITHAPWGPGRTRSLEHLLCSLAPMPAERFVWSGREPNWAWSDRIWAWGAACPEEITHVLFLQDDVRVCPGFWDCLAALVERFPENLLGLETIHPQAARWALQGYRAYRVRDCCIGVGYVWPRALLRDDFLPWTRTALLPGVRASMEPTGYVTLSEDTLMGCWAHARDQRIVSPLPTLIDHDLSLPSTYGHGSDGPGRAPFPTWTDWPSQDLRDWSGAVREAGWQYATYILRMCSMYVRNPDAPPIEVGPTAPHPDDSWKGFGMHRGVMADGVDPGFVAGGE
jgi:hypothetical protein